MNTLFDLKDIVFAPSGRQVLSVSALTFKDGQHCLITGPSGSGKTTLLNILSGLVRPHSGVITFQGQDIQTMKPDDLDLLRAQTMGFVFQGFHLVRTLTVRQNIELPFRAAKKKVDVQRLHSLSAQLNIDSILSQPVTSISQGEAQRCAIARAVVHNPKVILADEPTSALDDGNAQAVMDVLKTQAQAAGATVFISTHDSRISHQDGFRSIHLNQGKVMS